jgi:hypothetical protein
MQVSEAARVTTIMAGATAREMTVSFKFLVLMALT